MWDIRENLSVTDTYDHRTLKTRLPVRSALFKQRTGGLVVRWVNTRCCMFLPFFLLVAIRTWPCKHSCEGSRFTVVVFKGLSEGGTCEVEADGLFPDGRGT
jgi:hypothetical protein